MCITPRPCWGHPLSFLLSPWVEVVGDLEHFHLGFARDWESGAGCWEEAHPPHPAEPGCWVLGEVREGENCGSGYKCGVLASGSLSPGDE